MLAKRLKHDPSNPLNLSTPIYTRFQSSVQNLYLAVDGTLAR